MFRRRRASPWQPLALFAGGEKGAWFDPSDITTLFQDTAGTTPVTAAGQTVALMRDKSGNGYHATQATAAQRPTYQVDAAGRPYLSFDGVDDGMVTGSVSPVSVDKLQVFVGVRKSSDAATGIVLEMANLSDANAGSFAMFAPAGGGANSYRFGTRGSAAWASGTDYAQTGAAHAAPDTAVLTGLGDIAGDSQVLRRNGAQIAANTTFNQGTGNFGSYPLYIGRRGNASAPLNGRLYGGIVRFSAANLPASTISAAEAWMNSKTGAY